MPSEPSTFVKIQWVLYRRQIHHVSEFTHLLPGKRPDCYCPVCEIPVILRLGQQRAFHAAHRPSDICAATQPETALHLNVKYYLYQQLLKASRLDVWQHCQGWKIEDDGVSFYATCDHQRPFEVAINWSQVVVEQSFGAFRPDLTLLKDETPLLGIEVLVTHRVEEEKREAFKEAGLYWIEIEANEEIYSGPSPWTADLPLTILQAYISDDFNKWQCDDCIQAYKHELNKLESRKRAQLANSQRSKSINTLLRFVDIYYPSGKMFREIFSIKQVIKPDGTIDEAWLEKGDYKKARPEQLAKVRKPITEGAIKYLAQEFDKHLEDLSRRGWVVDSPMGWQSWPKGLNRDQVLFEKIWFPNRYSYIENRWQPIPNYTKVDWNGFWANTQDYIIRITSAVPKEEIKSNKRIISETADRRYSRYIKRDSGNIETETTQSDEVILNKQAVCIFCGETTTDYWYYDGKGNCKCRACYSKGKA